MKSVIFDLDGTLLNTLKDLTISTNYALTQCNYPTHTIEEVRKMVGNGVGMLIHRALPSDVTEQEFDTCFNIFKEHYTQHCEDNTAPYPGITQLLEQLYKLNIQIAIASNKLQSAVTKLAEQYFSPYVTISLGDCKELKRKPEPDMLLKAMEYMKSTPNDTIYVGDSEVDLTTAKAAGIKCISVLWGFRDKELLIEHGANIFASTPEEIISYLDNTKK